MGYVHVYVQIHRQQKLELKLVRVSICLYINLAV